MQHLFSEYISLSNQLKSKGGRGAVVENSELEELYNRILRIEDEILKRFGLPGLIRYRDILLEVGCSSDISKTIARLDSDAKNYLRSTPKGKIGLLEEAKRSDLRTYDLLPELGIEDRLYTMFVFEECFKKGIISAEHFIEMFKSIDDQTFIKLANLRYYSEQNINLDKADAIRKELMSREISYIEEFVRYRPVYPY